MKGYLICYKVLTDSFNYKVKFYKRKKPAIKFYIKILREQVASNFYASCNIQEVEIEGNYIINYGNYLKGCFFNSALQDKRILEDKRRILKYYY